MAADKQDPAKFLAPVTEINSRTSPFKPFDTYFFELRAIGLKHSRKSKLKSKP
jgi:hypothetical protein